MRLLERLKALERRVPRRRRGPMRLEDFTDAELACIATGTPAEVSAALVHLSDADLQRIIDEGEKGA